MNPQTQRLNSNGEEVLAAFRHLYQLLGPETVNLQSLRTVYRDDIHFEDPFHQIDGLAALCEYFDSLYENVLRIRFEFHQHWLGEGDAMQTWTMYLAHKRLNGGKPFAVEGCSLLRFDQQQIYFHRDYFDGGQLLYENVPILGAVIRKLKQGLA